MAEQCPIEAPRRPYVDCSEDCVTRYFDHEEFYFDDDTGFFCKIVRKYRWDTCDVGIGIGRHVYSITLLPGEEIELEEVHRDSFSRALHDKRSLATELELTLEETVRDEVTTTEAYSFEHKGENKFNLLALKRKGQRDIRASIETVAETLTQSVAKAAARVAAKNEIALAIKSEVQNVYRSTRKVRNPNPCQPVTYNFYQIAKRLRRTLTLVDTVIKCSPPAGDQTPPPATVTFRTPVSRPQARELDVVAAPPVWQAGTAVGTVGGQGAAMRAACEPEPAAEEVRRVEFETPREFERSRTAYLDDVRLADGEEAAARAARALAPLDDLIDPNGGGVISEEEICIGTTGFHVEGVVSQCAVCEDTELRKKELEVERCRLELEMLRCEVEKCRLSLDPRGRPDATPRPDRDDGGDGLGDDEGDGSGSDPDNGSGNDAPRDTRPDDTRPDDSRPDDTRPDNTRPDRPRLDPI